MRARDIKPGMGLNYYDSGGTYRTYAAIALDRPYRYFDRWLLVPITIKDHPSRYVFWALAKNLSKILK